MNIQLSSRIRGTAPYAFAEVDKKVAELKAKGVQVIDFGVGDPSAPTPDFINKALYEAAQKRATYGYPNYAGDLAYRQACADYLKREYNVTVDPETEITSHIGSKEAVFHFPLGFVDPGDIVICPTPGYPPYRVGTRFAGGEPYFVPLLAENDFLIDVDSIPEAVVQKAKIIWTNYPNSPTGKCAPRAWLEKLIQWAHKYSIIIAADEGCYNDMYFDKKPVSILEVAKEGIITFYSLSKRNNMTGWRVGFCAGDKEVIGAFRKVKTNVDSGTPTFIQDAAAVALQDTQQVREMCEEYKAKMGILNSALTKAGLPNCKSEATFYLWQKAPEGMNGEQLVHKLLEIGLVVTPGVLLSDETESGINPGENYVRFALVAPMDQVKEAAERIETDLKL